jgi:hypothetical protein
MRQTISISKGFFCDGHCYVMTSASLGGSGLTVNEVSGILFAGEKNKTAGLLKKGVCFPVCFEGDCALDGETIFVIGDLTEQEEQDWIARLRWKLNIPCGKLILCCGCLAEDLERAVTGEKPDPHFEIYQVMDVPPAEYLVEIYAFLPSLTVQLSLAADDEGNYGEDDELAKWYQENRPGIDGVSYVIRLSPLENEPALPEIESGWFEKFEFRDAPDFRG